MSQRVSEYAVKPVSPRLKSQLSYVLVVVITVDLYPIITSFFRANDIILY